MADELDEIRKTVRDLTKQAAVHEERIETLTKMLKNHEHDERDGCTKFDMGYL